MKIFSIWHESKINQVLGIFPEKGNKGEFLDFLKVFPYEHAVPFVDVAINKLSTCGFLKIFFYVF